MGRLEFEEFLKTLESERKEAKIDWENKKRQFLQAGCEVFGLSSPGIDAEVIRTACDI